MRVMKQAICMCVMLLCMTIPVALAECKHELNRGGAAWTEYESYTSDAQMHFYVTYVGDICVLCDEVVNVQWTDTGEDYHSFDENNVCTLCGFAIDPNCKHENRKLGADMGLLESSVPFTDTQHYASTLQEIYCGDCGVFLEEVYEYYWKEHYFGYDGECICGAPDPSLPLRPLTVVFYTTGSEAEVGSRIGGSGSTRGGSGRREYYLYGYSDTGLTVSKDDDYIMFEAESPCTWIFELTVTDTETGEVVTVRSTPIVVKSDCPHEGERHSGSVIYTIDTQREATETQHYAKKETQQLCADCGMLIDTLVEDVWEDHWFGPDGVCSCGYMSSEVLKINLYTIDDEVCVGEYFAVTAAYSGGSGQYSLEWTAQSIDGQKVVGVNELQLDEPGTWMFSLILTDVNTGETARATSDSISVVAHKTLQPEEVIKSWKPAAYDKSQHYARITHTVDTCVDCGAEVGDEIIIKSYDEDTAPIVEPHVYEGNTCAICGYSDNRYTLCCPDAEYYFANAVLIPRESSVKLRVMDNNTGTVYRCSDLEGMSLEYKLGKDMSMSKDDELWIKSGAVDIELRYQGVVIYTLAVGTIWLDVTTWGWNEGNGAGTLTLRMEDLQNVPWNKTGLWLNTDEAYNLCMFDFASKREGDYYIVTFDVYNSAPVIYGVASYYPDGSECDREMIDGFTPEWGLLEGAATLGQVAIDTFSPRYGDSGAMTKKTEISLRVPICGAFRFLEANNDDEVALQNVVQLWVSALVTSADLLDMLIPGDTDTQDAVKEELQDPKAWKRFLKAVTDEMLKELGSDFEPLELMKLTQSGGEFAIKLLADESVGEVLLDAVEDLAIDVTFGAAKDAVVKTFINKYAGANYAFALDFEDKWMKSASTRILKYALEDYANGELDVIQFDYVFIPNADSVYGSGSR